MAFVQALPHYCPPDRWNEVLLKLREESCSSWEALGVESMCVVSEVSNWGGMQDDTLRLVIMRLKDADSAAGFAAARPEALEDAAAISEETCRSKFEKASAEGWVGKLSAEQFAAKFSSMNGGAGEVMKELRAADLSEASFAVVWRADASPASLEELAELMISGRTKGLVSVHVVRCGAGGSESGMCPFLVVSTFDSADAAEEGAAYGAPIDEAAQSKVMKLTSGLGLVNRGPISWKFVNHKVQECQEECPVHLLTVPDDPQEQSQAE
eukprot:TRINITY_DN10794_c0_g1_i2.p1 TRINITY_DN10794_c0_g1~~TRINITY_DN10794_c0_g1_i2.p1  ORF type:complete len:299 (-),score=77.24 TRINITY_DN10794_c0_g1_i2:87-890(-)